MSLQKVLNDLLSNIRVHRSGWKFETSGGVSVSVGTPVAHLGFNAEGGAIYLYRGSDHLRLIYGGVGGSIGASLVPSPVNLSFSMTQMPSYGVVYQLPFAGRTLDRDEFLGGCVYLELNGDVGPGWVGSVMFMGGSTLAATTAGALSAGSAYLPALLATSTAVTFFTGMTATLLPFNASLAVYVGGISPS